MKIDATGIPASSGVWVTIGKDSPPSEVIVEKTNKEIVSKVQYENIWWDDSKQLLLRKRFCPSDGSTNFQSRQIDEEKDQMILTFESIKGNGKKSSFKTIFRRK
jgi:hypothetical protein